MADRHLLVELGREPRLTKVYAVRDGERVFDLSRYLTGFELSADAGGHMELRLVQKGRGIEVRTREEPSDRLTRAA